MSLAQPPTGLDSGAGQFALRYFSSRVCGSRGEAIDWAEKAVNSPTAEAQAKAKAFAVLAMASWRNGQKDAARTALAKGDALAPNVLPENSAADLGESWMAWLMARISLDEATALMRDDK